MNKERKPRWPSTGKKVNLLSFYCDNHVSTIEEMPDGPHYAAIIFDTKSTWTSPYAHGQGYVDGTSGSESVTEHYVFTDLGDLKLFLQMAKDEKKKFVFYAVPKMGKLEVGLKLNVDIEEL